MLERSIPDLELLRVFADDLTAILRTTAATRTLVGPFSAWRRATGLSLNLKETVAVPLAVGTNGQAAAERRLREELESLAAPWPAAPIVSVARYLGVYIGPPMGSRT